MSIWTFALETFETQNAKIHKNGFMTEMLLFMILGENHDTGNFKRLIGGIGRWRRPNGGVGLGGFFVVLQYKRLSIYRHQWIHTEFVIIVNLAVLQQIIKPTMNVI